MLLDDLNILNLLRKIQESTTQDVDEEQGSFKVGDRVIYNMYGTGLTNSDLIRMLGANEHASRVNHHEKEVKILEAEGDKVACYKVRFDDGFVINGVSVSELKSVSEKSKANEDRDETSRKEHLLKKKANLEKEITDIEKKVKEVESDLKRLGSTNEAKESKTNEAAEFRVVKPIGPIHKSKKGELGFFIKIEDDCVGLKFQDGKEYYFWPDEIEQTTGDPIKLPESKTNEAAEVPQTMQPQEKPNINAEDYHMEDYSEEDLEKVKSKSAETGNAIRQVEDDELKQEPGKAKKESITSKVDTPEDTIISAYKEARRNGKSREEATQIAAKASKGQADSVAVRRLLDIRGVRESESTFTKQKPLWLCNSCFKTFRSDENICGCKSTNTEKITEGEGWAVGHLMHVYDVKFELNGKEDSTRVEAFDEADAKSYMKKISRLRGAKILGITKVQEDKMPGGLADKSKPEDFDKEQLEAGIKVEMEHTKDPKVAQEIAMDHLTEDPDYYKKLKKMEAGKGNPCPKESKVVEKKFTVYYTAGGVGKDVLVIADDEEGAKAETKMIDPDAIIHSVVEESRIQRERKITETVKELIGETPGISVEDQKILHWAVDNKIISSEFPNDDEMFDVLSTIFDDPMMKRKLKDVHNLGAIDRADWDGYYLKYAFLPKAKEAYAKIAEPKTNEQKEDWDITFKYDHDMLTGNPLLDKEGNPWGKHSIEGRRIRVFTDYQAGWVAGKGATPVRGTRVQEQEKDTFTTVAKGLEKVEADKVAGSLGGIVVVDEEDKTKFAVIRKNK
jgi:hypothetical protein